METPPDSRPSNQQSENHDEKKQKWRETISTTNPNMYATIASWQENNIRQPQSSNQNNTKATTILPHPETTTMPPLLNQHALWNDTTLESISTIATSDQLIHQVPTKAMRLRTELAALTETAQAKIDDAKLQLARYREQKKETGILQKQEQEKNDKLTELQTMVISVQDELKTITTSLQDSQSTEKELSEKSEIANTANAAAVNESSKKFEESKAETEIEAREAEITDIFRIAHRDFGLTYMTAMQKRYKFKH
jgi:hypothetical protein